MNICHVDTCYVDYLTDHHDRDGEALFGICLGTTAKDAAEQLESDIADDERIPEREMDHEFAEEIRAECDAVDWRRIDPKTADPTDEESEDDEEQPSAWFLVTWDTK